MEQIIVEANSKIYGELKKVVSADMDVFYNPVMQVNRDFSIMVLEASGKKQMKIADALAGSGIRALRLLKELKEDKIKQIYVNDLKTNYTEYFQKNLELNNLSGEQKEKLVILNQDARTFLIANRPFDYIDIDPFGTPNPFLDSAIQSIRVHGILSITATDTSSLCGSYPMACKRKYFAKPLRNEWMHEFAARILIRKVQLIGIQYDKALTPIFTYAKDHYTKIFFKCEQGKTKVDKILEIHREFEHEGEVYGPIWIGQLWDSQFVDEMLKIENTNFSKETIRLLGIISQEKNIETLFFHDVHKLSEKKKTGDTPRFETIIEMLKSKGFSASRTHFSLTSIKTNATAIEFEKIFDKLNLEQKNNG